MSDLAGSRQRLQPVLELATAIAVESIPAAVGAGISLIADDGTKTSAASTHPLVSAADDRQYELGEGPCLTSWADKVMVRIDNQEEDSRWPSWAAAARGLHLRSVLSTPLHTPARTAGAMKVYSDQPYAFDSAAEQLLVRLAEQAAMMVDCLLTLEQAERLGDAARADLRGERLISMAEGVLVERDGLSPEAAIAKLTDDARRSGRTLADHAAAVISPK